MKKVLFALVAFFATTLGANAMSFEQAREQALFLTDKMAYELNLTDDQYEAAYEVNLDYLLGINTEADLYGVYWTNRNLDMSYILAEWQYRAFCDALYFYRPIYWGSGYWHFRIFARYPHRTFYYFSRPAFYHTYHGGHSWRNRPNGGYYRNHHYGASHRSGGNGIGMRDSYRGSNNHGGFNRGGNGHNNSGINRGGGSRNEMNRGGNTNMNRGGNSNMNHGGGSNMNRGGGNTGGNRSDMNHGGSNGMNRGGNTTTRPSNSGVGSYRAPIGNLRSGSASSSSMQQRSSSTIHSSAPSRSGISSQSFGGSRSGGSFSGGSHSGGSFSGSHGGGSHGGGAHAGGRR